MRYERVELLNAFKGLTFNEKPAQALIAASVGLIPLTLWIAFFDQYFIINLFLAALIYPACVALYSRFVSRLHTAGARLPVTLLVGSAYVILGIVFQPQILWFLLIPLPLGIVFIASDIKLSRIELYAVDENIIRPFTIEFPSHKKLLLVPIAFTAVFAILCNLILLKVDQGCLTDIENNDYEVVLFNCASHDGAVDEYDATKEHKFGNYFTPTAEAELIKSKAEEGDKEFQYIWWFILDKIYRNEFSVIKRIGEERYNRKADSWLNSAASSGSVLAKKAYIIQHLQRRLSTVEQKRLASKYAQELESLGLDDATRLLEKSASKTTQEDVLTSYRQKLSSPETLSYDDLEKLKYALQEGEYFYDIADFEDVEDNVRREMHSIDVSIDTQKVLDILHVMSDKFNDADASFEMYNLLVETSEEIRALTYLEKAAEQGHARASGILGEKLFCADQKIEGLSWLTKSAKSGDRKAKRQREEIAESKKLSDCL